jgi:phospholipid/cholesterol/gamma-HCH transport system substrate-binding protein
MLAYGALGAAVVALAILILSSGGGGYTVRAEFKDLGGLRKDSSVKVGGVAGGTVESVTVTKHDTAIATFKLDKGAAPIGAGASVEVRPTDLLGERYAQLNVGDLNHSLPSGSLIPVSRTSTPVELDDILNTFNADVRTRLRILITEAGVALTGRGADFSRLLYALPPNLDQARQLVGQVASENTTLKNLISEGDRVTAAVNAKRDDMGNLINTAQDALSTVAAKQAQLGSTIASAPGALSQLRATLDQLAGASDVITPAAQELQAAATPLASTLNALPAFASSAHATLNEAVKVAPDLERLATRARSPLRALRPTAGRLATLAKSAAPILTELDKRGMKDTLLFGENWALGTKGRDVLGHFIGADFFIDPSMLTSATQAYLNTTPGSRARARHEARHARPSLSLAPVATPSSAPVPKPTLRSAVNSLLSGARQTLTKVGKLVGGVEQAAGGLAAGVAGKLSVGLHHHGSPPPTSPGGASSSGSSSNNLGSLIKYLIGP